MVVGWCTRKIDTGPFEDIIQMKPSIVEAGKGHRHFCGNSQLNDFSSTDGCSESKIWKLPFLTCPPWKQRFNTEWWWEPSEPLTRPAISGEGYHTGIPIMNKQYFQFFFVKKWKSTFVTDDLVKLHASLSHKALSRHRLTSRSMCMKPCVTICFRLPLVSKSPHNNCAGKSRAWISLVHRHSFYLFSIFLRS